jgi:acetyl esterase
MALDADAQRVIDLIIEKKRPRFETLPVAEARDVYRDSREVLQPEPRAIAEVRDLSIDGPGGKLAMRLYRDSTAGDGAAPGLVWLHGGGWVIGDLDSHDGICREIAHRSGVVVVSVDYRLAPEAPFPAAVDDTMAALRWVSGNAASLGMDPARISIGGDSAGGNLAAVGAMLAKTDGAPAVRTQVLVYPVADLRMGHASHARLEEQLPIPRSTLSWFYELYVPEAAMRTDWRVSPVLADDGLFKDLAPALLITAGYDPLGDEGLELGEKIAGGGAEVENARYEGQIHGFLTMGKLIGETHDALDRIAAFLNRHKE